MSELTLKKTTEETLQASQALFALVPHLSENFEHELDVQIARLKDARIESPEFAKVYEKLLHETFEVLIDLQHAYESAQENFEDFQIQQTFHDELVKLQQAKRMLRYV